MASKRATNIISIAPVGASSSSVLTHTAPSSGRRALANRLRPGRNLTTSDQELKSLVNQLLANEGQAEQLLALKLADGSPFFTMKNKHLLLDALAITDKLGFDDGLKFLQSLSDPNEIVTKSPLLEKIHDDLDLETELLLGAVEQMSNSQFKCPNASCGSRRIAYYQKQKRSADEGMDLSLRCTACGERWNKRG